MNAICKEQECPIQRIPLAKIIVDAAIQQRVAFALSAPVGPLLMIVKSAHIYATERDYMEGVVAKAHD